MAAPGPPVVGTTAQSTTGSVAPTLPASIVANDIVCVWAVNHQPVSVGTMSWPSGFAEIFQVNIKDSAGTVIGTAGAAWKRMAGGESGTITVTRTGDNGTDSSFGANCARIPGCITSGNPYEAAGGGATGPVTNAPNASTTGDFPSITTVVAEAMLLTGILKGGLSGNYSTPSGWTLVIQNSGTQGTDHAMDVDYRQLSAAGSYDPASATLTTDTDTGWAAFQIPFIPAAIPPFPTVSVVDDFNRSNQQPPGSSWLGSWSAGWQVQSNQLVNLVGGWDGIYWNATPAADQECFVTLVGIGANATQMQLHIRRDSSADTGYFVGLTSVGAGNDNLTLWRRIAGSDVQVGADDNSRNFAAGDKLGLQIIGSDIYVWHKAGAAAWSLVMARSNSDITAAGVPAIFSNAVGWILDDFGGPAVAAAGVTLAATMSSTSDMTAAPLVQKALAVTLASTSGMAAAAKIEKALLAVFASTSAMSSVAKVDRILAATFASTSDMAAVVRVQKSLASTFASVSGMNAAVRVEKALAIVLGSGSDMTGTILPSGASKLLAADMLSSGAMTAVLRDEKAMATLMASTGSLAALLRDEKALATIFQSSGAMTSVLRDEKAMAAIMASTSTLAAALRDEKALAAVFQSYGFMSANLTDELEAVGRILRLLLHVGR